MRRLPAVLSVAFCFLPGLAAAQLPSRPGPWVVDLRLITNSVPDEAGFFPPLDAATAVPGRGFGGEIGAHVYLMNLGASRIGLGASVSLVRGIAEPAPIATGTSSTGGSSSSSSSRGATSAANAQRVQTDLRAVTPQVSFNFGSREGWSYLSAGYGVADIVTRTVGPVAGRRATPWLPSINFGGGARWFMKSHFAVGFDLRFRRIASGVAGPIELEARAPATANGSGNGAPVSTPSLMVFSFNVGLSFR